MKTNEDFHPDYHMVKVVMTDGTEFTTYSTFGKEGDVITLEVANDFCEVWLKDNYLGLIRDVLQHASGQTLTVKFQVGSQSVPAAAPAAAAWGRA